MYIKEIINFNRYSGEADIVVSDGNNEILCYCHPITNSNVLGSTINIVSALLTKNIMRIEDKNNLIRKKENYYSYFIQGKVLNVSKSLISIGNIKIKLDMPLPKDIKNGDFVEFEVERLNCSEWIGGADIDITDY